MSHQTEAGEVKAQAAELFVPAATAARAAGISTDALTRLALKGVVAIQQRPGRTPWFNLLDAQTLATSRRA